MTRGKAHRFSLRFWGVRGSYPTPGPRTLKFGGHTSCVEVLAGRHRLIFDAGTGIIPLGKELLRRSRPPLRLCIFLSHTHHDHLIGLYFFEPLLQAGTQLRIFGPDTTQKSLGETLETAMDNQFFPIGFQDLKARKEIYSLKGGDTILFKKESQRPKVQLGTPPLLDGDDQVIISAHKSAAHPRNGVMLYRVTYRKKSLVYATDIEERDGGYPDVIEFARGTDLLIHDAQYLSAEYYASKNSRRGWGHSTVKRAIQVARSAGAKRLILFHHEPTHDDKTIQAIERRARRVFPATAAAYEGMKVVLR